MNDVVRCPHCGREVDLSEALTRQMRQQLASEVEQARRAERAKVEAEAQAAARVELDGLRADAAAARAETEAAKQAEFQLRRQQGEVERARADVELTVQRRLAEEREGVRTSAVQSAAAEFELRLRERDAQLESTKRQLEEALRRAQQGSQQLQGEVLETSLEDVLRRECPQDGFEPVAKGQRGGDLLQRVIGPGGADCGSILWETKRTKNWSADWLPKLRDDQRAAKADLAALVATALPREAPQLSEMDGVWVASPAVAGGLARVLRRGLVEVAAAHRAAEGKDAKTQLLYDYFNRAQFKNRMTGLQEPLKALRDQIQAERDAMQRLWSRRETQIQRAILSLSGLYGDLQGIAGEALPELGLFELPAPRAEDAEPR